MDRRLFLGGAMALAGAAKASAASAASLSLADAAKLAWLYGLPLIEVAEVRRRTLALGPPNRLHHQRDLTTPATQKVTSPNNDTLYSRGFLELSRGPVTLTLPATGERYFSVALMDMFTNNFAVLGTRTTGPEGGRFTIAGPSGPAPAGAVRAPSNWVFVLGRTLVDGPQDIDQARTVQDRLLLDAPPGPAPTPATPPARTAPWRDYFAGLGALLAETIPPATDAGFFHAVRALGLTPKGFSPPAFSPAQEAEIASGVAQATALASLPNGGTYEAGGWTYPQSNLGTFEQDYLFRGQIALTGLFALPLAEAMYTRSVGDGGQGLFRGDRYRLTFPQGQLLPVDGFWSLTVYRAMPDGQFFFAPNPIDRWSIGDRTPGLTYNKDGSLDLWISREDPGAERRSNWLPTPQGPFMLSLRAFMPRASLLTGQYRAPPVIALP
ncbi:MAG: DUF1254 domain-containing protein [Pseudomonadota bacterium]|uniref:DUF1254 domain-containing protein n=1 Tax=Phenylobacterium sp. TaxID=1871053 RepID=UPI0025D1ECC6|nr:DUF1254 domain-containing protein [Phenylobacterium sp.]MBT9471973.1 DUF1254 domain-containing protein [Phenylobacterium sp.]